SSPKGSNAGRRELVRFFERLGVFQIHRAHRSRKCTTVGRSPRCRGHLGRYRLRERSLHPPNMKTYLAFFLIAAFSSAALTPLLRRFCERHALVDSSLDQRRIHQKAVPRLGGVAIFISIGIALCSLALVHNLLTQTLRTELKPILSVMICGLLVLLIGAYDD